MQAPVLGHRHWHAAALFYLYAIDVVDNSKNSCSDYWLPIENRINKIGRNRIHKLVNNWPNSRLTELTPWGWSTAN